jgi:hypothetical protein
LSLKLLKDDTMAYKLKKVPPKAQAEWYDSVQGIFSMTTAELRGKGPEPMAFVSTLRVAADHMETLLQKKPK